MPRIEKRRISAVCAFCRLPITDDTMATESFGTMVRTLHGRCLIREMNAKREPEAYHAAGKGAGGRLPSTVPSSVRRG